MKVIDVAGIMADRIEDVSVTVEKRAARKRIGEALRGMSYQELELLLSLASAIPAMDGRKKDFLKAFARCAD